MRLKHSTRTWLRVLPRALCAAALLGLACAYALLSQGSESQRAAKRWLGEGGGEWAQYTLFFPADSRPEPESLDETLTSMQDRMEQELPAMDGIRGYFAWSCEGELNATAGYNTVRLRAVYTGGDYFFFNPYTLLDGSRLRPGETERAAVLDENAAWKLFGSREVSGVQLELGGVIYTVTGVVETRNPGSEHEDTAGTVYLPAASTADAQSQRVSCLYAVMPELLPEYSRTLLVSTFPQAENGIVKNSGRFSPMNIVHRVFSMRELVTQEGAPAYTPEENEARWAEYRLSRILEAMALLSLLAAADILPALLRGISRRSGRKRKRKGAHCREKGAIVLWRRSRSER